MSVALLARFSTTIVQRLVDRDLLVVVPGRQEEVVQHLAEHLANVRHASLISAISKGLISSPDVEELFAEDDDIKEVVESLDRTAAGL
jgi:hypothetical protein